MAAGFDPAVAGALLPWYDEHARDLPWRRTKDPYRILISEIMLQQTQVKTVLPYYAAFLERFPDVGSLAAAPLDDVLAVWKGLGYYRRAKNLHAAAKVVAERFGGRLPDSWDEIRSLPGVGDYTAAAVLSIAYGRPYPVVDGNVIRVGARLLDADESADSGALRRRIYAGLAEIIPADRPGDFNQAMMELGATLCAVQRPRCVECPLVRCCRARSRGREAELPVPPRRKAAREERFSVIVFRRGGATLLVRRPGEGLLADLWEFPRIRALGGGEELRGEMRAILSRAGAAAGDEGGGAASLPWEVDACDVRSVGSVEHRFSHLTWRFDVLRVELAPAAGADMPWNAGGSRAAGGTWASEGHLAAPASWAAEAADERSDVRWVEGGSVEEMPLPRAMQKAWELVRAFESTRSRDGTPGTSAGRSQ